MKTENLEIRIYKAAIEKTKGPKGSYEAPIKILKGESLRNCVFVDEDAIRIYL